MYVCMYCESEVIGRVLVLTSDYVLGSRMCDGLGVQQVARRFFSRDPAVGRLEPKGLRF